MQNAEFDHRDFEQSAQKEMDKSLLVKFYMKTVPDQAATEEAGRPMFKDVEYIDIRVVGKKNGGVARPARPHDFERFPQHYAMFKNRIEAPVEGTPLSEWPVIARSTVETLAFMNVKTVEQLAELSDTYCSQIMGGHGFKDKAKKFLAYADEVKVETDKIALKEENEQLRADMAEMKAQIEALQKKDSPAPKKRVRKTVKKD